jgi:hypothetical protein
MSRPIFVAAFLALSLQVSQAQLFNHGAPASVTSPGPNGRQNGVPASVVSPRPLPPGIHAPVRSGVRLTGPARRFSNLRSQRRAFLPVPLFYPIYSDGLDPYSSAADPYVPADPAPAQAQQQASTDTNASASANSDDELRAAYLQGARDALVDSRYGDHYLDSRERNRPQPAPEDRSPRQQAQATPQEDHTPATIFVFKDGHQVETKNYAIMSGTLFDFSGKVLKKIQLDDLDSTATQKANDDRGVSVKLP